MTISSGESEIFLKRNPFYILNVSVLDNRRKIMAAADEMSFWGDADSCAKAQQELLAPEKRLDAELDWFTVTESFQTDRICRCIQENTPVPVENLTGLSRLNADLYNLSIQQTGEYGQLGKQILALDDIFSELQPDRLTEEINRSRSAAGFVELTKAEMALALSRKRTRIQHTISMKTDLLNEDDYIDLITMLARQLTDQPSRIVLDLIDQYVLRIHSQLEIRQQDIFDAIQEIKKQTSEDRILHEIDRLEAVLTPWSRLVQPIQLKSQSTGIPDDFSEKVALELRTLSIYLNNEKSLPQASMKLVTYCAEKFSALHKLRDQFRTDRRVLQKNVTAQKENDVLKSQLTDIEKAVKDVREYGSDALIDTMLKKSAEINRSIQNSDATEEEKQHLRLTIFAIVYNCLETLVHADNGAEKAIRILDALSVQYSDIAALHDKAQNESKILTERCFGGARTSSRDVMKETIMGLRLIIVVLIIIAGFCFYHAAHLSTGSSEPQNSAESSSHKTALPPVNAEEKTECRFTVDIGCGVDVYADITSVFPAVGVYKENSSYYHGLVCQCRMTNGMTVWMYISPSDYRAIFDPNVSTSVYTSEAEEIYKNVRIHGWVTWADSIIANLSDDIGAEKVIWFESAD